MLCISVSDPHKFLIFMQIRIQDTGTKNVHMDPAPDADPAPRG